MIISFIVCPNGYGHLFRTLEIIDFLNNKIKNIKISIFCSITHKKKIKKYFNLKNIKIFPIIPNHDLRKNPYQKLMNLYNLKLENRIFKNSNFIFSDNLVNKHFPKNKTILHTSFFWSDIFKLKSKRKIYKKFEKNFINENIKYIITNRYFFIKKKEINSKIIPIGFTGKKIVKKIDFEKKFLNKKILVYFSGSDKIPKNLILNFLEKKYKIYSNNSKILNLSKKIIKLPDNRVNLEKFSYMITKPGLGSIKDCLNNKIFPIFYFRKDNLEYKENFNKLKKIKKFSQDETFNEKKIFQNLSLMNFLLYKRILKSFDNFKFDGNELLWKFIKKNAKKI